MDLFQHWVVSIWEFVPLLVFDFFEAFRLSWSFSPGNDSMDCADQFLVWELEGRLPILYGHSRASLTPEECVITRRTVDSHGLLLFRGFDLSMDKFVAWSEQLCGSHGLTRTAPGGNATGGSHIGLHTEDAMLSSIPSWIWFYAAKPADKGGETALCDGAAIVSALGKTALAFLAEDILYWWRAAARPQFKEPPDAIDPPGIERNYRGPFVDEVESCFDVTALCQPIIRSRTGTHRVFGNHILNTIEHDDYGRPPRVGGFHRARTRTKEPLPEDLLAELKTVASQLQFYVQLEPRDILWLDNTRFLHGRSSFEGTRNILVRKVYDSSQLH